MDQAGHVEVDRRSVMRRTLSRVVGAWIVLPLFFLASGGSLQWWAAWAYCTLVLVPMTVFALRTARSDPEFLDRRFKMREKVRAQRQVVSLGAVSILGAYLVPGLDHRFGWSSPPVAVVGVALALCLAAYLVILRVFLANRWAGRTVETYEEQRVVSTGPYALVRHPMYAAGTVLYLATPVALGSWWGLVPALGVVPMFVLRIRSEEAVLVRDLPGYEEYRRKVRWRLVPFLW